MKNELKSLAGFDARAKVAPCRWSCPSPVLVNPTAAVNITSESVGAIPQKKTIEKRRKKKEMGYAVHALMHALIVHPAKNFTKKTPQPSAPPVGPADGV